jgi:ribonuclease BN (tRNA processing enzyme)
MKTSNQFVKYFSVALFINLCAATLGFADRDKDDKTPFDKVKNGLSVMVLGSGGPVATPERASAGYMVFVNKEPRILMDVGGGVHKRIGDASINIADLDIVLLSHLHIDHMGALSPTVKMLYFHNRALSQQRTAPIRFYGPDSDVGAFPHTDEYVEGLYDAQGGLERYLHGFAPLIANSIFAFEADTVFSDETNPSPELIVDEPDGLKVYAIGVQHGPVPSLAFRIEYGGKSIVYSGDTTSAGPNMVTISQGADLLIYDTAILDDTGAPFINLHTTPTRIGEVAAAAEVSKLVLSHITAITEPNIRTVKGSIRTAGYRNKIVTGKDLQVFNLHGKRSDDQHKRVDDD